MDLYEAREALANLDNYVHDNQYRIGEEEADKLTVDRAELVEHIDYLKSLRQERFWR
jgi:hypothetical protein